jgi:hypothetical protein
LRDDENIGEDNGSIDEPCEPLDRLKGDRRGDLGIAAALEEITVSFGFVVLWKVATSCEDKVSFA